MRAIFYTALALGSLLTTTVSAQSGYASSNRRVPQQVASAPAPLLTPHQENARQIADLAYNTWRVSHANGGNEVAWKRNTTESRIRKVHNLVISQRGRFPQDYFREAQYMPVLENFVYVGSIASCGGNTLAATYMGRLQLGDEKPQDSAFVILLVNEGGKWKIDQTRFFSLEKLPAVRKRLAAKDISVLLEQDGFHPYREMPKVPPYCGQPELIGKIFVDCPGRDVDVKINGVSLHEFYDERRADVISGGLKRGSNTISYTIREAAGKPRPSLAIGLFVMPETPGNTPVCVFDHILDEHDDSVGGSFTFQISNAHIASMNPKFQGPKPAPFHAVPLKQKQEGNKGGERQ